MKPKFENLSFVCWEHPHGLGTQPPCLCFKGDAQGVAMLLAAIDELQTDGPPAQRKLTLKSHQRSRPIHTIRLLFTTESEELRQMCLTRTGDVATLEFTPRGMKDFRDSVLRWQQGGTDFCIDPEGSRKARHLKKHDDLGSKDLASGSLWFWSPYMDP